MKSRGCGAAGEKLPQLNGRCSRRSDEAAMAALYDDGGLEMRGDPGRRRESWARGGDGGSWPAVGIRREPNPGPPPLSLVAAVR
jgi:hypothetical protein